MVRGLLVSAALTAAAAMMSAPGWGADPDAVPKQVDLLTFAAGAVPVEVGNGAQALGVGYEQAIAAIDGDDRGFVVNRKPVSAGSAIEVVYELPAPTTFTRFVIPNVLETPSPSQTFVQRVEILGSTSATAGRFVPLAAGRLSTHPRVGDSTTIAVGRRLAVRRVKLRLIGGIEKGAVFVEFSELSGYGRQSVAPMSKRFTGSWDGTNGLLELRQAGSTVRGCYDDGQGTLTGTVSGTLLVATGKATSSGVRSSFIVSVAPDGTVRGVRSDNGAPFRLYEGVRAARAGSDGSCAATAPAAASTPTFGCGSVVHGIRFAFDSAAIRPESGPVLAELHRSLRAAKGKLTIEGHTSSEGSDAYNLDLSARRARSVVDDLVRRGLPRSRLAAVGRGERSPIARNDDESGRSLNRRVEIRCAT